MVSVCIATYNGEKYLKEQIDSILIQLEGEDELIISDDNSTDSTLQILKEYDDARIKIIEANQFNSPIYNFENAIKYSKGNIIILSDQDDIWYPYKVDKIKTFLKKYLLVFSNATIVDEFCHGSMLLYQKTNNTGFLKNLVRNHFVGAAMAFRKELLPVILPFPRKIPMHDQWIGLLAEIYGKTYYISEPLIYYRRHASNASFTGKKVNSVYTKSSFSDIIFYMHY